MGKPLSEVHSDNNLTFGGKTLIAEIIGGLDGKPFAHNNQTFIRNNCIITDDSDLDPSLLSKKRYVLSGGTKTFQKALGQVVASTIKNPNGTVIVFQSSSQSINISKNNGVDFTIKSVVPGTTGWRASFSACAAVSPVTGTIISCLIRLTAETSIGRTTDDGDTWSVINAFGSNHSPFSVFCDSDGAWYLGTDNGVIRKSTNDGVTWTTALTTTGLISAFGKGANGRIFFAKTSGSIGYTDDKFTTTHGTSGNLTGQIVEFVYLGNNIVIGLSNDQGSNKNVISTDNGASWAQWTGLDFISFVGCQAGWSDGNGKALISALQQNYNGTKDQTLWMYTTNYGQSFTQIAVTQSQGSLGLKEGKSNRLFYASNSYNASDNPEPYGYFDLGFTPGGDINNTSEATLIKDRV